MVTPVNNGQMDLKINFNRYWRSVLRNDFLNSFAYYLKGLR